MDQSLLYILFFSLGFASVIFVLNRPIITLPERGYITLCIVLGILAIANLGYVGYFLISGPKMTMADCGVAFLSIIIINTSVLYLEFRGSDTSRTGCIPAILIYFGFLALLILATNFLNKRYEALQNNSLIGWQDHIAFFIGCLYMAAIGFVITATGIENTNLPIHFKIISGVMAVGCSGYAIYLLYTLVYEDTPVYVTGFPVFILLGLLMFQLKIKHRDVYGKIEILFGLFTLAISMYKIKNANLPLRELIRNLSPTEWLQLLTSIYIFIRGMDNLREYNKTTKSK